MTQQLAGSTSGSAVRRSTPSRSGQRSLGYRPALDGIRALAVLSVMLYHGTVGWAKGGFLGVDVFFVLSGYLITSLLLAEWNRWGSVDIVRFYLRRARRLLPAIVLVTIAIGVWARFGAASDKLGTIRVDGIASLFYVANWRFVMSGQSYFDQFGDPSPFRHMWSLAIEEQYYLFFPLVLVALVRWFGGRRRSVALVLGLLAAASALEMAQLYNPGLDTSRIYFGTDTRMQELLTGSVLGVLLIRRPRLSPRTRVLVGGAGPLALLGLLWAFYFAREQGAFLYRGGFALVCLTAAVLIASVELAPRGPISRILALRPFVLVGIISYGLYLWHWPIFIVVTPSATGLHGVPLLVSRFLIAFGAATASYLLVERPIRQRSALRRIRRSYGRALAFGAVPVAFAVLLTGTLGATAPPLADSPFGDSTVIGAGENRLLLVGDSVGLSLSKAFPVDGFPGWSMTATVKLGCGLSSSPYAVDGDAGASNPECRDTLDLWKNQVQQVQPKAVLMSIGSWEVLDRKVGGKILKVGSKAYAAYLRGELEDARTVLTSTGAKLFLFNVPCYGAKPSGTDPFDPAPVRNDPKRGAAVNEVFTRFAAAHSSDTRILDLRGRLCPKGRYVSAQNGIAVRPDGVHFSEQGAVSQWSWLMPQIEDATLGHRTQVLVLGDSVPYGLGEYFPAADHRKLLVKIMIKLGCYLFPAPAVVDGEAQPLPDGCEQYGNTLPQRIAGTQPDVALVFAGIGDQFDRYVDGQTLKVGTPAHEAWLTGALDRYLAPLRRQQTAIALVNVPCHRVTDTGTGGTPALINDESRVAAINQELADYARVNRLPVLDLNGFLCAKGYRNSAPGVSKLRKDGLHFTASGAAYVWNWLDPQLRRLDKSRPGSPTRPSASPSY